MTGVGVHPIRIDRAPTRVAPNGWSPARADLSGDVLREIHLAVLVVDDHDRIVYANEMAVASLGDDLVNSLFAHLWRDDPEDVHHALVSVASAPDWRAFNLRPRNQSADAPAVLLRGRRLVVNRPPVTPSRHLIITCDQILARATALIPPRVSALPEASSVNEERRELVHRVKNNLALLTSLVRTARRNVHDENAGAEISTLERRLMSIAAMHEVLDSRDAGEEIHVGEMLKRVCDGLVESLAPANVAITTDLAPIELPVAMGSPIALIANELVTNALKHGFPDGRVGSVHVSLKALSDGQHELAIRDDGIGTPAETGQRARGGRGHGGDIVRALAVQLGGTLEKVDREVGTEWRLRFGTKMG